MAHMQAKMVIPMNMDDMILLFLLRGMMAMTSMHRVYVLRMVAICINVAHLHANIRQFSSFQNANRYFNSGIKNQ